MSSTTTTPGRSICPSTAIGSCDKFFDAKIGDRIECSGYFGTIRYIGSVDGHQGTWLGIDWDNPDRGKHDGSVKGIRYFAASHPTSGSFVRPEKVNFGRSAIKSITSRYGRIEDEYTVKINQQNLLILQQSINAPFLHLVGFDEVADRQSNFKNLKVINLRLQNLKTMGGAMELKKLCPNVCELDVSKNLLTSWSDIFNVCEQLDFLEWLNVSENILTFPEDCDKYLFPNLRTLICGAMKLTWDDIIKLSAIFPGIEELRAISNEITHLDTPPENNFKNVRILDLEGNAIREWSEICKLGVMPNLQHMILENIQISNIKFENCGGQQLTIFQNVLRLALSNNLIDNWESIGELNKLKRLEDLRFIRNPILETENLATQQELIIARIANLKILNAAEITATERRGAEYDYLKKYGLEWLSVKDTEKQEEFLERHNRYLELIEKYGQLEEDELRVQPNMIQSSLVNVTIEHEGQSLVKKLPKSLAIQKLIMLVQRVFKLDARPKLQYISFSQPDIEIELDDECKELGFYSVQDGDRIIAIT